MYAKMKKPLALLFILIMIASAFCSCGVVNSANKPNEKKLSEEDIRIIKETMKVKQESVSQKAFSLDIKLDTLNIMKIAGSLYTSSDKQKQFDTCYDCCAELLEEIESMVDYYREYPDLFVTVKSAIEKLITIHDNILSITDQGNDQFTFTEDTMRKLYNDVKAWDEQYSSAFSKLLADS